MARRSRIERTILALERRRLEECGWSPDEIDQMLPILHLGLFHHNSAHRMLQDESIAPWQEDDLASNQGNTTAGAGILPSTYNKYTTLRSINASTPEIRTLPDPIKAYITIGFALFQKVAQNLVVRCSTPIWLGATVTQPALTQNGQFITFGTLNHSVILQSVPCTKTSFTGTQVNPFVNITGFRWMLVQSDGPTVT